MTASHEGSSDGAPGHLTGRDVAALLFVAEMYAVQLDQLAAVLGVTEARARAITLGWRRCAYAESATALDRAAQAKDQAAAKAAHGKLTESCKGCHQQHRGMGPRGG